MSEGKGDDIPLAYISSSGGRILECNSEFARMVGSSLRAVTGSDLASYCKFADAEQLLEAAYQLDNISDTWKAMVKAVDDGNEYEVIVRKCSHRIRSQPVLEATISIYHPHRRDSIRRSVNLSEHKEDSKEAKDCGEGKDSKEEQCDRGSKKVLVVDDSPTALKIMAHIVTRTGHQVTTAANGVDALAHLREEDYDIVLMDINMPMMNGLQASHELRKMERVGGKHQKIIAMSGDISSTLFTEVSNAGFDAFIPKPLTEESFLEVLNMRCRK